MPRPLWKGAISFGLVTVPVSLYSATQRKAEVAFRLLHNQDNAPINYRRFCSEEEVEVEWRDVVKGYEYQKGKSLAKGAGRVSSARGAVRRRPGRAA